MPYKVFLSHSMTPEDFNLIKNLTLYAQQQGIQIYLAERDWRFGKSLPQKIEQAIRNCDCLLALLTKGGANSPWVNQEIGFARGIGKPRIFIVEKGVTVKGFDLDKGYISLDRTSPWKTINMAITYLKGKKIQKEQNEKALLWILGGLSFLLLISKE